MLRRLRIKFVLINMTIVTVMLCVLLGLLYYATEASLERASVAMLQSIAENPFQPGQPVGYDGQPQLPYFTLQLGAQGEVVATGGGYYDLSDEAFLADVIDAALAAPQRIGRLEDYSLRFYRAGTPVNQFIVFVDTSSEQATLANLLRSSLLLGALGFLVFLGISILLARWAVRPVEEAWRQQRQFVSDASHELKTPLTVIMTNAELLQDPACGAPECAAFSANILTMSRQMRRLLEQMLQLARADDEQRRPELRPVDWSQTVSDAVLPFEPLFFESGRALESAVEPDLTVRGDEASLRQLPEILLDNARKYSSPGGRTRLTLTRLPRGRCLLRVADEGAPIPPEALKKLFKRFYRADEARSRDGSFGLGLSIAEGIVAQHRGKIWVESAEGINSFYVELPMET